MTKRSLFPFTTLSASLVLGGCGLALGLDDYSQNPAASSSGNAGQGGSAGEGTGGTAGAGGAAGAGGMNSCMPGTTQACYAGPAGTQGVGLCKGGTQTCLMDGSGYGPCDGAIVPAAETCALPDDEDCDGTQCSETMWARIFGDAAGQQGVVVAADGQGGVFVAGTMDGTVKFDNDILVTAGKRDIFLSRIGPDGKCMWTKRFGNAEDQDPSALTVDAQGNVYLAASIAGATDFGGGAPTFGGYTDVAIASFQADGTFRWSRQYGDNAAQDPEGLAIAPTGELIVAGSFGGSMNTGKTTLTTTGDWDVFLLKLDPATGDEIWAKKFGSTDMEQSNAVGIDSSGGIIISGRYKGYVSFGGGTLPISAPMLATDINVFVVKLDADGKHVWSKGFGDAEAIQLVNSLAVDQEGSVLVTGEFEGTMNFGGANLTSPPASRDIYLAKLSSSGMHSWSKKFGGNSDDRFPRVAVDSSNNVFMSCQFTNSIDFGGAPLVGDGGGDVAVARLNPDGSHVWSRRFGETPGALQQQLPGDLAWSPGVLFVTGAERGTTNYGTGPLMSAGSSDVVVFAIEP